MLSSSPPYNARAVLLLYVDMANFQRCAGASDFLLMLPPSCRQMKPVFVICSDQKSFK